MTRVGSNSMESMLYLLQREQKQQTEALNQLSTGRSVNVASDGPAAESSFLQDSAQAMANDQYKSNINSLTSLLQTADSALGSVVSSLQRAITLGTEGATGTLGALDRKALANEILGIQDQILSLANTTYGSQYIFGGTETDTAPFVLDSSTNTVTYDGNSNTNTVKIGDSLSIQTNVAGDAIFTDVFTALQDLANALNSNDTDAVATANAEVQGALEQVTTSRVFYGNALNRLDTQDTYLDSYTTQIKSHEKATVGADTASVVTELSQAQTAYQATLSAMGNVAKTNLLDYLN